MDQQIRELKELVHRHLYQTKDQIGKDWKKPLKESDNEIWFFRKYRWIIFRDKVGFIFQDEVVVDIFLINYVFGIEYRNVFYSQHSTPEYKVWNKY